MSDPSLAYLLRRVGLIEDRIRALVLHRRADDPAPDDPFRGPGEWYVVHTYAGYKNKVKTNLESRIHTMQMEGKIFRVHIPMEDVMEIKGGKKQVVQKKVFPGYLLVKMDYDNDSWYVVRNTPGVTGFVSAGTGTKPTPLSKREVEKILVVKKEEAKPGAAPADAKAKADEKKPEEKKTDAPADVKADAPAGDAPAGDAPAGDAPAGDVKADAPAGDAPAGDAPAGDAPAGDAPADAKAPE